MLLCNKSDLKESATVTEAEISNMRCELGFPFLYTSAKTGENVEHAFLTLSRMLLKVMMAP